MQRGFSEIGGGSLSTEQLPTFTIVIKPKMNTAQELARALRMCDIPIYSRVADGALILDFRTVLKGEEKFILQAFTSVL